MDKINKFKTNLPKDSDDEEDNLQFETKTSRSGYGS